MDMELIDDSLEQETEQIAEEPQMQILRQFLVAWHPDRNPVAVIDFAMDDHAMLVQFPDGSMRCMATVGQDELRAWINAHDNIGNQLEAVFDLLYPSEGAESDELQ